MLAFWILIGITVAASIYRAAISRRKKNFAEVWLDSLLVNVAANLLFLAVGYFYREEIYNQFQKARLTLASTKCTPVENHRKHLFDCQIELRNEREKELSDYKFILSSSARYSNFNFDSCTPVEAISADVGTLSIESNAAGLADCKYRISLGSYRSMKFHLTINGDNNEPDPEILQ